MIFIFTEEISLAIGLAPIGKYAKLDLLELYHQLNM